MVYGQKEQNSERKTKTRPFTERLFLSMVIFHWGSKSVGTSW